MFVGIEVKLAIICWETHEEASLWATAASQTTNTSSRSSHNGGMRDGQVLVAANKFSEENYKTAKA